MISKKTAERIWHAHREIEAAEKLLSDMEDTKHESDPLAPTLKDAFGRERHLQSAAHEVIAKNAERREGGK